MADLFFETTYKRDDTLQSVARINTKKILLKHLISVIGGSCGFALALFVALMVPSIRACLQLSLFDASVISIAVMVILSLCSFSSVWNITKAFPRTITVGGMKVIISRRENELTFLGTDCRWRIGTLHQDSDLRYGSLDVPAVLVEVRLGFMSSFVVTCGLNASERAEWPDILLAAGVKHHVPRYTSRTRFLLWGLGSVFGMMLGGVLALIAFIVGMKWVTDSFFVFWHFGLWTVFIGMAGIGVQLAYWEPFYVRRDIRGTVMYVMPLSIAFGLFVGSMGGLWWILISIVSAATAMGLAAVPAFYMETRED